jgi:hypothetical protein
MAKLSQKLNIDLHSEKHLTKNVESNFSDVQKSAIKAGRCPYHLDIFVSEDFCCFKKTKECPRCRLEINSKNNTLNPVYDKKIGFYIYKDFNLVLFDQHEYESEINCYKKSLEWINDNPKSNIAESTKEKKLWSLKLYKVIESTESIGIIENNLNNSWVIYNSNLFKHNMEIM